MTYKIKILPAAKIDIEEATGYYFNVSLPVYHHFNERLDEALISLENNPYFQVRFKNVRGLPLKRFPYLVLFEIDETAKIIYILSVFCTHQTPKKYP